MKKIVYLLPFLVFSFSSLACQERQHQDDITRLDCESPIKEIPLFFQIEGLSESNFAKLVIASKTPKKTAGKKRKITIPVRSLKINLTGVDSVNTLSTLLGHTHIEKSISLMKD